jgi:hypothetical protein
VIIDVTPRRQLTALVVSVAILAVAALGLTVAVILDHATLSGLKTAVQHNDEHRSADIASLRRASALSDARQERALASALAEIRRLQRLARHHGLNPGSFPVAILTPRPAVTSAPRPGRSPSQRPTPSRSPSHRPTHSPTPSPSPTCVLPVPVKCPLTGGHHHRPHGASSGTAVPLVLVPATVVTVAGVSWRSRRSSRSYARRSRSTPGGPSP